MIWFVTYIYIITLAIQILKFAFLGVNADSSGEEDSDDEDDIHKGQPETHDLVSNLLICWFFYFCPMLVVSD